MATEAFADSKPNSGCVHDRPLSAEQISQLTKQGCSCADWSQVSIAAGFDATAVRATHLSGRVRLGAFNKRIAFLGGIEKPSGISYATIHNCTIGDNVYIDRIGNCIANYAIESDVIIENVDLLAVDGESSFGNGTEVAVVNEAGGREIPIYDRLSAHIAYILAFYRHRPQLIERLKAMIGEYTASVTSSTGRICAGSRLSNCRIIKNLRVGPATVIEGANKLENGSINSCPEDPVYIGPGVYGEDFIICSGSKITDGTIISECFVGQGVELARQYSAENSVFFANCGGFHGEACAIFAGPYTVTHHKSTLLIAGLFSFLNAGSGTNQSNHMYKLGPNHQGIVERGSKTASDSYMLWPAKVGPFTVVMGRHYKNSDTSDLPFSYLIEHEDESILIPGVNLRSVGTVRDARKWPKRDRRRDPNKLDYINFKLLSPYTIQKMLSGSCLLRNLRATSGENTEYFTYNNVKIPKSSLEGGIEFYAIGTDKYLGNCLIKRLEGRDLTSVDDLHSALAPQRSIGAGKWIDLAGLLAPQEAVEKLLGDIESGVVGTLGQIDEAFRVMHEDYAYYEWTWAAAVIQQRLGRTIDHIGPADVIEMVQTWKSAVVGLDRMLYADAKKEFAGPAQIGFGVDGDQASTKADFEQVRGTFDDNSFVREIEGHIARKTAIADELIARLEKIPPARQAVQA
ncbi:MAG: DUF4954 family protein [Sedimentisphaerales bacterium]|nr:DUF4954 family protein [Sedimentisphaerales bacterium]